MDRKQLVSYANDIFERFHLTEQVIEEIWNRGWKVYVLPQNIWGCWYGGRIFYGENGEKFSLIRGLDDLSRIAFFHELLHIQLDQEEGLGDAEFRKLAREIPLNKYGLSLWQDYEHECIDRRAVELSRNSRNLMTLINNLHKRDKKRLKAPVVLLHSHAVLHPHAFETYEQYYANGIPAIYYGVLDPFLEDNLLFFRKQDSNRLSEQILKPK